MELNEIGAAAAAALGEALTLNTALTSLKFVQIAGAVCVSSPECSRLARALPACCAMAQTPNRSANPWPSVSNKSRCKVVHMCLACAS